MDRITFIDILKGIAIIGVISIHFNNSVPVPNNIIGHITTFGVYCPQLFFLISSFLLWKSMRKYNFSYKNSTLDFYCSKLKRILPTYFLALIIYISISSNCNFLSISTFTHLSLINAFFPNNINDIIGVEWYVSDFIILITIAPILFQFIKNLKQSVYALTIGLIFSFIIQQSYLLTIKDIPQDYDTATFFNVFCFAIQFPVMILGIVLYYIFNRLKNNTSSIHRVLIIYFLLTILCILLFAISFSINIRLLTLSFIAGTLWGGVFLVGGALPPPRILLIINHLQVIRILSSIIRFLGKYSLGIYLFHMIVIRYYLIFKLNAYCNSSAMWLSTLIIIIIFSTLLGWIAEKTTEIAYLYIISHNKILPNKNSHIIS